jgi:hypothetical protein
MALSITLLAGAKLYFFIPGSTTARATYTDSALSIAHAHPVVADSGGQFPAIYLNPALEYKCTLRSSSGELLDEIEKANPQAGYQLFQLPWQVAVSSRVANIGSGIALTDELIGETFYPRTDAEAAGPPDNFRYPELDLPRYGFAAGNDADDNTTALQLAVDVAEDGGGGRVIIPRGSFNWSGDVEWKSGVSIRGHGPFQSILTCTTTGVHGFSASTTLNGVEMDGFQLVGNNSADASSDGIRIVGDASGGSPKLILRNLLVKQWGNVGVYVENCFDALIEAVNASSNKSHGFQIIGSFSLGGHKNVAYQNDGHGYLIQRAAGSFFSGTAQENKKNGWVIESARGCLFVTYVEQNGHDTATDTEKAQIRVNQTSGGFARSAGVHIHVFGLGGAGSTSPTMESKYGVYVDNAHRIKISGSLGGHLDSDIRITSNAQHVLCEDVDHITGLTSDTPTPVNDTSTENVVVPVRQQFASVPDNGTGNVGAGEDDLFTYTLPGGTLWRNGQGVEIHAWGTTAANANTKRLRVYFGATVVADTGAVAANADEWTVIVRVYRRGPTVQYAVITASKFNGAPITGTTTFTAPAETLASDITIKCTGEATADNDIVQRGLIVRGL